MPEIEIVTDADGNVVGRNIKPTSDEVAADGARKASNDALTTKERIERIEDALGL